MFDTEFHQSMPPEAYTYSLPKELAQQHGIRRYGGREGLQGGGKPKFAGFHGSDGEHAHPPPALLLSPAGFHGISYSYLVREAARMLGKPLRETNLIVCHLGAGSSMCAVAGGRSVDTTMGACFFCQMGRMSWGA